VRLIHSTDLFRDFIPTTSCCGDQEILIWTSSSPRFLRFLYAQIGVENQVKVGLTPLVNHLFPRNIPFSS